MDKLVAQYSRPQHQNEFYSEQEQQDLTESVPPLSLKFALPPVDNVSLITLSFQALELGQISRYRGLFGSFIRPGRPRQPAMRQLELQQKNLINRRT